MGKVILLSVVIATVVLPMRAARDPQPARGLRRAVLWLVLFNVFYMLALIHVMPRVGW
jgi:hypothetical protein